MATKENHPNIFSLLKFIRSYCGIETHKELGGESQEGETLDKVIYNILLRQIKSSTRKTFVLLFYDAYLTTTTPGRHRESRAKAIPAC